MAKQWYVVHAYSGFEKQVSKSIREYIQINNMADFFGEILVPTEEVVEIRGDQRRTTERKFFPGYVLIEMEMNDETWHLVRHAPKVLGFIGGKSNKPTPISQHEVDAIMDRVKAGEDSPRPKVMFEPGEVVRIIEGPFTDFEAVVEEIDYTKNQISVSVLIFGRSTTVELEFNQVQKI